MDVTFTALSVTQPMAKAIAVTAVAEPGTVNRPRSGVPEAWEWPLLGELILDGVS